MPATSSHGFSRRMASLGLRCPKKAQGSLSRIARPLLLLPPLPAAAWDGTIHSCIRDLCQWSQAVQSRHNAECTKALPAVWPRTEVPIWVRPLHTGASHSAWLAFQVPHLKLASGTYPSPRMLQLAQLGCCQPAQPRERQRAFMGASRAPFAFKDRLQQHAAQCTAAATHSSAAQNAALSACRHPSTLTASPHACACMHGPRVAPTDTHDAPPHPSFSITLLSHAPPFLRAPPQPYLLAPPCPAARGRHLRKAPPPPPPPLGWPARWAGCAGAVAEARAVASGCLHV